MTRPAGPLGYRLISEPIDATPRVTHNQRRIWPPLGQPPLDERTALVEMNLRAHEVPDNFRVYLAAARPVRRWTPPR